MLFIIKDNILLIKNKQKQKKNTVKFSPLIEFSFFFSNFIKGDQITDVCVLTLIRCQYFGMYTSNLIVDIYIFFF